ncbi:hypothetical protein [Chryseobacterium sp.]|uniref:hypothetical protein n=1 Tax=Chryseobacterium sp. TaxID=1871047 RepID=UPI00284A4BF1|nr:hypothetical protein [Chryseobacterium sp.]MDR3025090.1 hypothetical protein [Chryseobacterium sp.]
MYPFDFDYLCGSSRLGDKQVCRELMMYNSGSQKTNKTDQLSFNFLFTTISWNGGGCCYAYSWTSVNKFQLKQ